MKGFIDSSEHTIYAVDDKLLHRRIHTASDRQLLETGGVISLPFSETCPLLYERYLQLPNFLHNEKILQCIQLMYKYLS